VKSNRQSDDQPQYFYLKKFARIGIHLINSLVLHGQIFCQETDIYLSMNISSCPILIAIPLACVAIPVLDT
ncbi:hypothetical protein ACJX0J_015524, partial [Zea mays]